MNRYSIFAGAVALTVMPPSVTLSAPTGGVYHAAPIFVRPAFPQRAATRINGSFDIPAHFGAPKPAAQTFGIPAAQTQWYTWQGWTRRPAVVWWYADPCMHNGMAWMPPFQTAANAQGATAGMTTIGSLAGNPAHSIFAESPSDVAALASSNGAAMSSGSAVSYQVTFQPGICGQPSFGIF